MASKAFAEKPLVFLPLLLLSLLSLFRSSSAARQLADLVQEQPLQMQYHRGPLLSGLISLNLIWYGSFKPSQRSIVNDFLASLSSSSDSQSQPSVDSWWKITEKYYAQSKAKTPSFLLGKQILDNSCSLGKSLKSSHILQLASKGPQRNAINIVLTASDVVVEGFCSSRCGTHGSAPRGAQEKKNDGRFTYIWDSGWETPRVSAQVNAPGPSTSPSTARRFRPWSRLTTT